MFQPNRLLTVPTWLQGTQNRLIMEQYLNDVVEAIQKVGSAYFRWNNWQSRTELENNMVERVFCYEFYHQFRKIMERKNDIYHNLRLNGEISKIIAEKYQRDISHTKFPDFVLHEAQNTVNQQELVIEVKTKNNSEICSFLSDIEKIDDMISQLNYKSGLFIAENIDNETLRQKIERANINSIANPCKIYFMATDSVKDKAYQDKYFTLAEVLGQTTNTNASMQP